MKRMLPFWIAVLMLLFGAAVPAFAADESLKVTESQVRFWIGPEGSVKVNEIHTYQVPEDAGEILRDFPFDIHENVIGVSAGEITGGTGKIGEVKDGEVTPVPVVEDGTGWRLLLQGTGGERTIILSYLLEGALGVYEEYSDLQANLFSTTSYEFEELKNLEFSVIFPGDVGASSIRPYTRNMNGSQVDTRKNGVIFMDPVLDEPNDASYRVFFPSDVMTETVKHPAPLKMEDAFKEEEKRFSHIAEMRPYREAFEKYGFLASLGFIVLGLVSLAVPQRLPITRKGEELIISLDLVYLYYVRWVGRFTPRVADAMLYSLLEKGMVAVSVKNDDEVWQFAGDLEKLAPYEQSFIKRFFQKGKNGEAFLVPHELKSDDAKKELRQWHESVLALMEDAGTLNRKISRLVMFSSAFAVTAVGIVAAVVAAMPAGWLAAFLAGILVFLYLHVKKTGWRWLAVVYGLYLLLGVALNDVPATGGVVFLFVVGYLLIWLFFPRTLLSSRFAYRLKYAIHRLIYTEARHSIPDWPPEDLRLRQNRVTVLRPKFKGLVQMMKENAEKGVETDV